MATPKSKLVTTVIPVYEAEKYLRETIDSVTAQSIGFLENINIVLVDDGSTDGSSVICKEYESCYPNNITYLYQENSGVSAARNLGMKENKNHFIHFLDSDDIISKDFYKLGIDFLKTNIEDIDFVAAKIKFFDANIDAHPNNYKFDKTRVIDVSEEPDSVINHVSSCIFTTDSTEQILFDTKLKIAEDAKFVANVLQKKRKYGVVSGAYLNYRKRSDESSAIGGQYRNKGFYTITPERFFGHMFDTWSDENGRPASYVQDVVLYDLMWRLGQSYQSVLDAQEEQAYKNAVGGFIKKIDDFNIISKIGLSLHQRLYMLRTKYGSSWQSKLESKKGLYTVGGLTICKSSDDAINLDFIHKSDGHIKIEGFSKYGIISDDDKIVVEYGLQTVEAKWVERKQRQKNIPG